MTTGDNDLLERNLLKALGHPLRLRLLEMIIDSGESSPPTWQSSSG